MESGSIVVPFCTLFRNTNIDLFLDSASPEFLLKEISQKGKPAIEYFHVKKENNKHIEKIVLDLKRRFRLLRVSFDVDVKEFTYCYQQLMQMEDELLPYFWNINLKISKKFEVKDDGTLCIKWNFNR